MSRHGVEKSIMYASYASVLYDKLPMSRISMLEEPPFSVTWRVGHEMLIICLAASYFITSRVLRVMILHFQALVTWDEYLFTDIFLWASLLLMDATFTLYVSRYSTAGTSLPSYHCRSLLSPQHFTIALSRDRFRYRRCLYYISSPFWYVCLF